MEQAKNVLDRALLRRILELLAESYPQSAPMGGELPTTKETIKSLHYLAELEMIKLEGGDSRGRFVISGAKITAKGLDFLADDGGYSAILGTITVKYHADTLKALLIGRVERSDLAQQDKNRLLEKLGSLGYSSTEHLARKLVDIALESSPALFQWLQKMLY